MVIKTMAKPAAAKAATRAAKGCSKEDCKWCAQGKCWENGDITKPQGMGKGGGKVGMASLFAAFMGGGGGGGGFGGNSWTPKFKMDKSGGELGEFTGTIKSFNERKAYGFIECDELASHGDIFLHAAMKKGFKQGQTVKFTGVLNKDGKAVAIDLFKIDEEFAMDFTIDKSGGELGEFTGRIKRFNERKAYGFIECDELASRGDIFLHAAMKKGFKQGHKVKFTGVLNKDGKAVAIDLFKIDKAVAIDLFKIDKSGGELGEFTGTIKSFNERKAYGFIECDELASHGDIFLHAAMKKGFKQGQTVKFTGVLNKDGKAVAIDLKSGLK